MVNRTTTTQNTGMMSKASDHALVFPAICVVLTQKMELIARIRTVVVAMSHDRAADVNFFAIVNRTTYTSYCTYVLGDHRSLNI